MKKQIFKAKVKPNQLVEFKVDDEQPNKKIINLFS